MTGFFGCFVSFRGPNVISLLFYDKIFRHFKDMFSNYAIDTMLYTLEFAITPSQFAHLNISNIKIIAHFAKICTICYQINLDGCIILN